MSACCFVACDTRGRGSEGWHSRAPAILGGISFLFYFRCRKTLYNPNGRGEPATHQAPRAFSHRIQDMPLLSDAPDPDERPDHCMELAQATSEPHQVSVQYTLGAAGVTGGANGIRHRVKDLLHGVRRVRHASSNPTPIDSFVYFAESCCSLRFTSYMTNIMNDQELMEHEHDPHTWWVKDAQGIHLCKVCDTCEESKLARYEPWVLNGYGQGDVDEPIEPDY